nr:ATP-binding protein [Halorubrum sp. JWXQ-INN 858]
MVDSFVDERAVVVLSSRPVPFTDPLPVGSVSHTSPSAVDDEVLAAADAFVIVGRSGLDRVKGSHADAPLVALVDDPTDPVAVDPIVDAAAVDPEEVGTRLQWLFARRARRTLHDADADGPSRIERLHAGTTRLATAESSAEAFRTAVAIAEEVFSVDHCIVGVLEGDWIEPVAVSTDELPGDRERVRVGSGVAGTVLDTGDPVIETVPDHDVYGSALTVAVGDDAVLQTVSTGTDAFDEGDLELAELLASHLEETRSRLRVNAALRDERDRLLALFENVPDPAVACDLVDGDSIVRRVNSAFEGTFGYDADAVIGESVDDYIVPADAVASAGAIELNAKLRDGENVRREVTRRTVDGDRHFILHVIPIHLDAENASGYAIYTDVTDRRERLARLRRQNEQLDEFTAIVSHDLRNPLSVAKGYLQLVREAADTPTDADPAADTPTDTDTVHDADTAVDHLDRVDDALDRMDELVSDLLSLAREGRVVGNTEQRSLALLAEEAWNGVDTGDAELVVEGDRTCEIDPNRVRELLENLFRNSVEHGGTGDAPSPGGSAGDPSTDSTDDRLTVRVGAMELRSGGAGGFYVEDDGRGFPDDDAERLFESGYTTDPDGTGLGLAICKHVAEAHGWDVRAMTGAAGGARFEFKLEG